MTAVRTALADQVNTYAQPYLRMELEPADQINPPVGLVMPGRPYLVYGTTLQGADNFGGVLGGGPQTAPMSPTDFNLDIVLVVSKSSTLDRQQQALDAWLGVTNSPGAVSVVAAVEADATLGGAVSWCIASSADPPGPVNWNGLEYYGTRIHFGLSAL